MDGRCASCKWWDRTDVAGPEDWGTCKLAEYEYDRPVYPESKALANSSGSPFTELETAPDFGCTQHEPIERKEPR